jgi:hypothetical protein
MSATCTAPGCERPNYSRGLCTRDYQRMRNFGTTDLPAPPSLAERLAAAVIVDDDGCWLWQPAPGGNGYGRLSVHGRLAYVHRVSYELHVGPIPDGLTIDHLCRVRTCVNPAHLEPVTFAENTRREMAARKASA